MLRKCLGLGSVILLASGVTVNAMDNIEENREDSFFTKRGGLWLSTGRDDFPL